MAKQTCCQADIDTHTGQQQLLDFMQDNVPNHKSKSMITKMNSVFLSGPPSYWI